MTWAEFRSWLAYYGLEPWGEDRADLRAGIVASVTANCHAVRKGRPFAPSDFMPKFGPQKKQTGEEMHALFKTFATMHNSRLAAQKGGA